MPRLFARLLPLLILCSCTTATAVRMINAWKAHPERWTNGEREVVFIPMVHVSRPEFYEDVLDRVGQWKARGYVVFFEGVKPARLSDSAQNDQLLRKMRKMLGFRPGTSYADMFHTAGLFRDRISQPQPEELGMGPGDEVVDITALDMVQAYERKWGTIVLDSVDLRLRIDTVGSLPRSSRLPTKQVMDVILNTRNEHLARTVQSSPKKNMVIVYGFAHKDGTLEQLRALDPRWKKR